MHTSETCSLLTLAAEPVVSLVGALPRRKGHVVGLLRGEDVLHKLWGGGVELGAGGNDAAIRVALGADRALALGTFAEDEAEQHVEATDGEKEEGGDKGEVVDVVREDLGTDAVRYP